MRDLQWIVASNGPEPPMTDFSVKERANIAYYGDLLSREGMTLDKVEMMDILRALSTYRLRMVFFGVGDE